MSPEGIRKGPWLRLGREAFREVHGYALHRLESPEVDDHDCYLIERDVAILKHLVRLSVSLDGPDNLGGLLRDAGFLATLLAAPGRTHGTSISAMWTAVQRFAAYRFSADGERLLADVEEHLIPRRPASWDHASRTPGGTRRGSRKLGRLIFAAELLAITNQARAHKSSEQALRDHAFAALCCWSPLRMNEICDLRWEHVVWDRAGDLFPIWVTVARPHGDFQLPVRRNGAGPLTELYNFNEQAQDRRPTGPVFRSLRSPFKPLGGRDAREILYRALERKGLRGANIVDLHAGFADFLERVVGLGELDITELFAYSNHEHTQRLLKQHHAYHLRQEARGNGEPVV